MPVNKNCPHSIIPPRRCTRREFLAATVATTGLATTGLGIKAGSAAVAAEPALVCITLDLEMARNFPRWEDTHWDFEKGNLNRETKQYAVEAGRRVKGHGGVIHYFLVGSVLEQENVDWLKELIRDGHPVGNHTYDHVNLKARSAEETQFRFARAPWLIEGKSVEQIVRENIELCTAAMKARLGVRPAGFRTPGGFNDGLHDTPHLQRMLRDLGFAWVSATYPAHPNTSSAQPPSAEVFAGIVKAQAAAQPFSYPGGLIDVPMSPVSDVVAFRNGRWTLEQFLQAIRRSLEWTIEHRACFDFLAHPSVLYAMDPGYRAIELICEMVKQASESAQIVSVDELAQRAAVKRTVCHHTFP